MNTAADDISHKLPDARAKATACGKPVAGRKTAIAWRDVSCGSCWSVFKARNRYGKGKAWRQFSLR